jgi:HD-like signal output (HDOD) protein
MRRQVRRDNPEWCMADLLTALGLVGVAIIVVAYFANQQDWLSAERWQFPAANLIGSLLILTSLYQAWNFPSVVIEVIWSAISLYGLGRRLRQRWP